LTRSCTVAKLYTNNASRGDSKDPSLAEDTSAIDAGLDLFPGLIRLHEETGEVQLGMATDWEISDDGVVDGEAGPIGYILSFGLEPSGERAPSLSWAFPSRR
jgi:hypothetical protein